MNIELILEGLNPQQKDAITSIDGPVLVLAGAGSGKTKVITHRFAYLTKKYSPRSILAMTFTNKAAGEMKERIESITKKDLKGAWVGTFHSQCNRILRAEIGALGYGSDFTIYDEDDQCNLVRHILKEFKIYEAMYKGIVGRISSLKSNFITPEEFLANGEGFGFEERLARVYIRYQDEIKRCNALDYDDLIMLTVKLFEEHPEVLEKYRSKFRHLLIDEFQDTNASQYRMLKLLCGGHRNICVVGDDDQSIYGFRGANIKNILSFEKDFPEAQVIKLEQNYRSTRNILDVSGNIIKCNDARRDKTLWSDRTDGEKVCHCWFTNEKEEATYISKQIRELYLKGTYDYNKFAVLYRVNAQSRAIEDALRQERMPYRVIGGLSFYARKEIKDITAYMRLVVNKDDNVSLRRIINVPARGVGASTLTKIEQTAKKNGTSLFAAIKAIVKASSVTAATKEKLDGFLKLINTLTTTKYADASGLIRDIFEKTAYGETAEDVRVEHIQEFIRGAEGRELAEFMDTLSLVQNTDDAGDENAISLLTLHSAKGLEFPVVFIAGVEEGVLPYFKAKTPHEISEERRLLYVGMTRAKDMLWLTGARKRRLYAKVQDQEPSRFLKDMPENSCRRVEKIIKTMPTYAAAKKIKTMKSSSPYSVGVRVRHPKWGVGVIRDSQGQGEAQKVTVNFPDHGIKRLALKFANIERIN